MTLKELRLKVGLTQQIVARSLNVDQAAVSHWESGKSRIARKHRKPLAKLYRCTVEELLEACDFAARSIRSEKMNEGQEVNQPDEEAQQDRKRQVGH